MADTQSQQPQSSDAAPVPTPAAPVVAPQAAGAAPYQSASLYVGDLHPDVTESLLYDIFNAVGPVASIRVCRDAVTRASLGYAYVNFHSHHDAERALETLNYALIRDRPCRIMWSQRDPSLRRNGAGNVFVKHLDLSIDNKALYDTFSLFGNILSCKVVTDANGKSRGYGFVHFETVEAADEAIRKINGMLIAGKEVFVGKFLKKNERPVAKEWTNVYIKNLPRDWQKEKLEDMFSACGPVSSTIIMSDSEGRSRGFGFVDFMDHESAVRAIEQFDGYEFEPKQGQAGTPNDKENDSAEGNERSQEAAGDESDGDSQQEMDPDRKKVPKNVLVVCRAQKKTERERELLEKFQEMKIDRQNKFQGVNLYVKNLDDKVDDEQLKREFERFGTITSAKVMHDRPTFTTDGKKVNGSSKGFGFVCFSVPDEAVNAVREMNGAMIHGKPIYVALAQRKEERRAQLEAQHRQHQRMMGVNGMGAPGPMAPGMYPYANAAMNPQMAQQMYQRYGMGMPGMAMGPGGVGMNQMPGMYAQGGAGGQQPRGGMAQGLGNMMPVAQGGMKAGEGSNVEFNPNARNTVGMMQGMSQQPMARPTMQKPAPMAPRDAALTSQMLMSATPEQRKGLIGEKLYPLVCRLADVHVAAKITGMLLEMDNNELLHLLESAEALGSRVREALEVLHSSLPVRDQK